MKEIAKNQDELEIRRLGPQDAEIFIQFLLQVEMDGNAAFFHPHPFSEHEALQICNYAGRDLYYALWVGKHLAGYGMLRGWDNGFETPSLGIVINTKYQGQGFGKLLMDFLHAAARVRGANRVRLKVYAQNIRAVSLYRKLGYHFNSVDDGQIVGYFDL